MLRKNNIILFYYNIMSQKNKAQNLYELLEIQENLQEIIDTILEIDDLNRWNVKISDYGRFDLDISQLVIDVENPLQTYTVGPTPGSMVPLPIDYGLSILEYIIWLIIGDSNRDYWDLGFDMYPMTDRIIEFLVINGAKSNPSLYEKWLYIEKDYEEYEYTTVEEIRKYKKIKKYLGLSIGMDTDESPDEPDYELMKEESARYIQSVMRGRQTRQKRKLTKRRYGQWATPTTKREKMRRWIDLTKMYSEDDPIRGYEQFSIYPERLLQDQTKQEKDMNEIAEYLNDIGQYGGYRKKIKLKYNKRSRW